MLQQFLAENRTKIIARTRAKVASRPTPPATEAELKNGIPIFLTQLVAMLESPLESGILEIGESAAKHGDELRRMGFTVGQVVHDYGGLCQAITEIAVEDDVSISNSDFKTLNACLDDAIASAVAEFSRQREQSVSDEGVQHLGFLAHELRNALGTATLAFELIKLGTVGASGSTSAVLSQSFDRMRELIDRSLAEVRQKVGLPHRDEVSVAGLIEEVAAAVQSDARGRNVRFTVGLVAVGIRIAADRHLLVTALTNMLHNAFKFSRPDAEVSLRTDIAADHVRIEIADECGGLPPGKVEELFRAFEQRHSDRSGLGLGLAISQQAIAQSGGKITVENLPGHGCVFRVDLPRQN